MTSVPSASAPPFRRRTAAAAVIAAVAAATLLLTAQAGTAGPAVVSLWAQAKPTPVTSTDTRASELGVRFKSVVPGSVLGIRFYKVPRNTGTHTAHLWTSSGGLMAAAKVTRETSSGWQRVMFTRPVHINAKQIYVASYRAPYGHYALTAKYFGQRNRIVWPLSVLGAPNGVIGHGPTRFPRAVTEANYWVDVLFRADPASAPKPTSTPPSGPVSYGWQLTGANTGLAGAGVDRTTLPVYTGSIRSGMTLSMVKITDPVDLANLTDVTLDRVWIAPSSGGDALVMGSNDVIKDSDISGEFTPLSNAAVCGIRIFDANGYAIERVHITGVQIGAWIDGNGTGSMTDSYLQANRAGEGGHVDGLTRRGGTGALTVARDRIEANVSGSTTGAFFLQTTDGTPIAGITVHDTMLEGIGYLMTLDNTGAGVSFGASNVRFKLTTANYYGDVTMYGAAPTTITSWTNMYDYDPTKPNAARRPVSKP